jgi:hypothetical protein
MKKSELKEMIKAAYLSEADFTNAQDDDAALGGMYDPVYEAEEEEESLDDILARVMGTSADPYMAEDLSEQEEEEETDIDVDAEEETDGGEEKASDSIVIDKKIVSLSSLPNETRKILDTLETLRAQAEEFGDQKFITQVGNTITFFTRDFVVAGDEPTKAKVDESLEILKMKKLAGLITEGEYTKALLKETELVNEGMRPEDANGLVNALEAYLARPALKSFRGIPGMPMTNGKFSPFDIEDFKRFLQNPGGSFSKSAETNNFLSKVYKALSRPPFSEDKMIDDIITPLISKWLTYKDQRGMKTDTEKYQAQQWKDELEDYARNNPDDYVFQITGRYS